jgi:hypothetical protein
MTRDELRQMVAEVKQRQSELDNVEVKTARGGTSKRLYESLSAFANRPGGEEDEECDRGSFGRYTI